MDFDAAMNAHIDWKLKLRTYIAKADGSLKAEVVGRDNECALGKWIYGEGKAFSNIEGFDQLRSSHAKFHQCAAAVIKKADEKKVTEAEALIASGSDYITVSNQVVLLIRQIKTKVAGS